MTWRQQVKRTRTRLREWKRFEMDTRRGKEEEKSRKIWKYCCCQTYDRHVDQLIHCEHHKAQHLHLILCGLRRPSHRREPQAAANWFNWKWKIRLVYINPITSRWVGLPFPKAFYRLFSKAICEINPKHWPIKVNDHHDHQTVGAHRWVCPPWAQWPPEWWRGACRFRCSWLTVLKKHTDTEFSSSSVVTSVTISEAAWQWRQTLIDPFSFALLCLNKLLGSSLDFLNPRRPAKHKHATWMTLKTTDVHKAAAAYLL